MITPLPGVMGNGIHNTGLNLPDHPDCLFVTSEQEDLFF
jgi:hypothetical protein